MTHVEQPARRRRKKAYGIDVESKSGARKSKRPRSERIEKIKHVIGAGGFFSYLFGRVRQAVSGLFTRAGY